MPNLLHITNVYNAFEVMTLSIYSLIIVHIGIFFEITRFFLIISFLYFIIFLLIFFYQFSVFLLSGLFDTDILNHLHLMMILILIDLRCFDRCINFLSLVIYTVYLLSHVIYTLQMCIVYWGSLDYLISSRLQSI